LSHGELQVLPSVPSLPAGKGENAARPLLHCCPACCCESHRALQRTSHFLNVTPEIIEKPVVTVIEVEVPECPLDKITCIWILAQQASKIIAGQNCTVVLYRCLRYRCSKFHEIICMDLDPKRFQAIRDAARS